MARAPSSSDQTTLHSSDAQCLTNSTPSANISRPIAGASAPHYQAGDPRNETTGKHPAPACNPQTAITPALYFHVHRAGPCGSDDSKQNLQLHDGASSPAMQPADRKDCTSECAARDR